MNPLFSPPRRRVCLFGMVVANCLLTACLLTASPSPAQTAKTQPRAPVRDQQHVFRRYVKSWVDLRRENVVMQQRDYSCGAAALATLIRYHLHGPATETGLLLDAERMLTVEELKDRIRNGLSMTDLRRLSVRLGYLSSAVRLDVDQLRESKVPLIVGLVVDGYNHFAVYRGMDDRYVYLADPARGKIRTPIPEFSKQWQKNAALVVAKKGETGSRRSAYMVGADETFLGELNRLYLRERLSSKPQRE